MLKRFAAAWRFLTVIPLPLPGNADELSCLKRSPPLFPAVGLALGVIGWCAAQVSGTLFPPSVAAILVVAVLAAFSGGLHLDGLADSADALLSATHDREKALAIMKDSRIGTYGALALALALLVKFACLSSLPPEELPVATLLIPLAGRAAILLPMSLLPYLRAKGLGTLFEIGDKGLLCAYSGLWVGVGMVLVWGIFGALAGFALWLAMILGWVWFLKRRLGGTTGDGYGAACELGEIAACLAAAMLSNT